ncbi:hypothetical protein [Bdellovibrio sp. HCB209]|uniref:hypothetical protein n=1 Tax=Bdellovibrio sp. HCB209 TaxID=3394354 RepID=UPI0039B46AD9
MNRLKTLLNWITNHRELILRYNLLIGVVNQVIWATIFYGNLEERIGFNGDTTSYSLLIVTAICIFTELILCDRILRANKRILLILSPVVLPTFVVLCGIWILGVLIKKSINWVQLTTLLETTFTLLGTVLYVTTPLVVIGIALRLIIYSRFIKSKFMRPEDPT